MNTTLSLESLSAVLLLGVATALVHMMFQLGVSVLTLLSGHSLGAKKRHIRLLHLNWSYISGAFVATLLVGLGIVSLIETTTVSDETLWLITALVTAGIGGLVCMVYYRRGKGTILWLPRSVAEYLSTRAKKTKDGVEATALGAVTVAAELPFTIAPLLIIAALLRDESNEFQLVTLAFYSFLVILPLISVATMIGAGHKVSTIQRWRESNKSFLQYSSGIGLIIIAIYLFVFHIIGVPA